ncbi:hypothetical protein F4680DRAFT_423139 [Xylaria scruposa]|nr:hypothetical protein F4680DRAFT_423139 [Xylaria scruposa]
MSRVSLDLSGKWHLQASVLLLLLLSHFSLLFLFEKKRGRERETPCRLFEVWLIIMRFYATTFIFKPALIQMIHD